ncbi:MAG: hypothetical protein EBY29_12770, partial [Planctomycetes bacterium]|nr:hypothetical protein [Planctomycetota bacterium]
STTKEEMASLEAELRDVRDALLKSNVEVARVTALFEESQRLLAARDFSLSEALKNVELLTQHGKQVEMDLAKSEHLRLHHETNHSSAQDELSQLEAEIQNLRASSMQSKLDLSHALSNLEVLQGKCDELSVGAKGSAHEIEDLRSALASSQHDFELLTKDMTHLQHQLETAVKGRAASEESLTAARHKASELESELKALRDSQSDAKVEFERQASELQKNVAFFKENERRLETELAKSEHLRLHHEGESKTSSDAAEAMEAELKRLREEVVKANMSLNHSSLGQEGLQASLTGAEGKVSELESELKGLREVVLASKDEVSKLTVDHAATLSASQAELLRLSMELAASRHEVELKGAGLTAKTTEADNLQLLLFACNSRFEKYIAIMTTSILRRRKRWQVLKPS